MVERSDRMWSTGEGNGKPLWYSCLENPMNSMKRWKDRILKEELPRPVGAQYATVDQWRNNYRKNEGMEPKQKQYPVVDVIGDASKIRCCKEQYCIESRNVRSINQGKLEVVKQKTARVNIDILGISKWRWTGMGEFKSYYHFIYYCGQESLRKTWSSHHSQQKSLKCSSVQFIHSVVSDSLRPHEPQHTRPPCPSQIPGVYSNSCPSSWWCHPAISCSVVPFSSCPQSLPASRSFPMSQLFA